MKNYGPFITLCCMVLLAYTHEIAQARPRVSIITSVKFGGDFIKGFMEDITRQTIFDDCELIMINADSPDNEEDTIKEYVKRYPNIIYKKLSYDPGLYGVWNLAISMSKANFITNANLDDRLAPHSLEYRARELENNPQADLVYSNAYVTYKPNATFEDPAVAWVWVKEEFSRSAMFHCLPGSYPMWRTSLHTKAGLFNAAFKHSGDYEMWLRAVSKGCVFKKLPEVTGLYYFNPKGLSTNPAYKKAEVETALLRQKYSYFWEPPKKQSPKKPSKQKPIKQSNNHPISLRFSAKKT